MIESRRTRWLPPRRMRVATLGVLSLAVAGWWLLRPRALRGTASTAPAVRTAKIRPPAAEVVEFLKASEPTVEVGAATYAADVAPILRDKCQSCHRPGQVAPF